MNKSLENLVELGVNIILACAVIVIIFNILGLGRETVTMLEKEKHIEANINKKVEFNSLNDSIVDYARIIELVTLYAGDLDVYVDSTYDNGAILISSKTLLGLESWSTVDKNSTFYLDNSKRIGGLNLNYASSEIQMTTEAQTLLAADLSAKFASGRWKIRLALNGEKVGNCKGKTPEMYDEVTGIKFERIS